MAASEVIEGMEAEEYHSHSAISKSDLDRITRSIAHYLTGFGPTTAAMTEGSAVHTAVLEPDQFRHRYAIDPGLDKRTKIGKEAYKAFAEENRGATILSQDQNERVTAMRDAVMAHPIASSVLAPGGMAETSVFWHEQDDEVVQCKARPDYITGSEQESEPVLVDLKTTADASPLAFAKSVANFRYHVQAAWYLRGWKNATGEQARFIFVCVESRPPHLVACYTLDEGSLAEGELQAQADLGKYQQWISGALHEACEGYPEVISEICLPRWAFKEGQ